MKKKWLWIAIGVVVIIIIVAVLFTRAQQGGTAQGDILRSADVIKGSLDITVPASGNVVANQKASLHFDATGSVDTIEVKIGDRVRAGQVLARLDAEALELALEEAQTTLDQAKTDHERRIKEAEIALESANLQLRQGQLRIPGVESAAAAVRSAEANLKAVQLGASEEAIAIAERQVEQAKNALWGVQLQRDATCGAEKYGGATETQCDAAQASVQQSEEAVRIAELQLQEARKGATAEELETATAQLEQAQAQYKNARGENAAQIQGLDILEGNVEEAQIALDRLKEGVDPLLEIAVERAKHNLEAATLTAPFNGIVADIDLQIGEQASAGTAAAVIVDDSTFFAEVTVDETDIGTVAISQTVEVTLDAYPDVTIEGIVETIAPAATSTGGVVSYPVRVRLSPTDEAAVRDGMTASVLIRTSTIEDVLLAPNWAVRTDQISGETYVYKLVAGQPVRTPVTVGGRNETETQLLSGVEAGDTVVLITEQRFPFPGGGGEEGGESESQQSVVVTAG